MPSHSGKLPLRMEHLFASYGEGIHTWCTHKSLKWFWSFWHPACCQDSCRLVMDQVYAHSMEDLQVCKILVRTQERSALQTHQPHYWCTTHYLLVRTSVWLRHVCIGASCKKHTMPKQWRKCENHWSRTKINGGECSLLLAPEDEQPQFTTRVVQLELVHVPFWWDYIYVSEN